jgi:hypothetical protein
VGGTPFGRYTLIELLSDGGRSGFVHPTKARCEGQIRSRPGELARMAIADATGNLR